MGINERIKKLESQLKKEKEEKQPKFKIPFGKKVSNLQRKKGYVTLVKLHTNGNVEFKKVQIEDQTFLEDDIPRLSTAGYVFYYKKNPFIFLPEWNVEPFTPFSAKEDFKLSMENGTNTKGMALLLTKMKMAEANKKKQINGIVKWIFIAVVLGIIVYAFIG